MLFRSSSPAPPPASGLGPQNGPQTPPPATLPGPPGVAVVQVPGVPPGPLDAALVTHARPGGPCAGRQWGWSRRACPSPHTGRAWVCGDERRKQRAASPSPPPGGGGRGADKVTGPRAEVPGSRARHRARSAAGQPVTGLVTQPRFPWLPNKCQTVLAEDGNIITHRAFSARGRVTWVRWKGCGC